MNGPHPGHQNEPDPYLIPLSEDGLSALAINRASPGGWAAYYSPDIDKAQARVLVRLGVQGGPEAVPNPGGGVRWNPADLADQPLEVRELHVAVAENTAAFTSAALRDIPFLRIEAAANHPQHRPVLNALVLPRNTVMAGAPDGYKFLIRPEPCPPKVPDLRVEDPGGYRKPDAFYERVGLVFLWLASVSSAPAQRLAEVNGVQVGTVHRWVREAKQRGLLRLPAHGRGEGSG